MTGIKSRLSFWVIGHLVNFRPNHLRRSTVMHSKCYLGFSNWAIGIFVPRSTYTVYGVAVVAVGAGVVVA